jgi:hypothetical protein
MHSMRQPTIDKASSALKSLRGRFARIDLDALHETATSLVRATVPAAFAPPAPRRRRWPIAGALIVLGIAVLGILYMSPMLRRPTETEVDGPEANEARMPDALRADPRGPDLETGRDASDVVTGPVGSASLRDPSSAPDEGADLEQLPGVELDPR